MFGLLLKSLFFLLVSGFCAFGLIYLGGLSGSLTLTLNDKELRFSIILAICVLVAILLLVLFCFGLFNLGTSLVWFISGEETVISRYFIKSRKAKGEKALLRAFILFYEGNTADALVQSERAKYLLKNDPLSLLINAQIAQRSGKSKLVLVNFKKLLENKDTRSVALSGIISEKIKIGEYESALELTKKSVELSPKNISNIETLFNLQLLEKDWDGARETLKAKKKYGKMDRLQHMRQDANLLFLKAKDRRSQGLTKEALDLTLSAVRQHPSFVAALVFLTELELMSGSKKRVEKLLQKGWSLFPHPDIAKAFAELVDNESAKDRQTRFKALTNIKSTSIHIRILEAELFLANRDFEAAKKLIAKLVKDDPDNYVLTLMAASEQGLGANSSVVREWLTKAVYAPKSFAWICKSCGFQTEWVCICSECDSFDSMEWRRPPFYSDQNENRVQIPIVLEDDKSNDIDTNVTIVGSISDDKLEKGLKGSTSEKKPNNDTVKQARQIN